MLGRLFSTCSPYVALYLTEIQRGPIRDCGVLGTKLRCFPQADVAPLTVRATCDCGASWRQAWSFRGARARGASRPALLVPVFLWPHVLRPPLPRHVYAWRRRPLPP